MRYTVHVNGQKSVGYRFFNKHINQFESPHTMPCFRPPSTRQIVILILTITFGLYGCSESKLNTDKTEVVSKSEPKHAHGYFEISTLDSEHAEIKFIGGGSRDENRTELFRVDRGESIDIQNAVVDKIVNILLESHLDTINWRSERIRRVVWLSMKEQDRNDTKAFIFKDFFPNYVPASPKSN